MPISDTDCESNRNRKKSNAKERSAFLNAQMIHKRIGTDTNIIIDK